MRCAPDADCPSGDRPRGTLIEHEHAWLLVKMGCAEPADEACREKAGMTTEDMALAAKAFERLDKGVHPDDFEAFDRGVMVGYRKDGSWIPGPNYEPESEPENEFEDEGDFLYE
jgi:hypothetical protein